MKSAIYNEVALVLLASKLLGRPVKWTSTRNEAFLGDAQARDNVTDAELALDRDGHFLGLRVHTIAAVGAYPQANSNVFVANLGTLAGVYRTPACFAEVTAVFSNTNPVRPYRGNGRPEAAFVIERMVELAARELGVEATELRRKNYISPAAMPFKTGLTFTYDSGEFEKNMDLALAAADVKGFKARKAASRKEGKLRGLGLSNTIERAGAASLEGAEVRFDRAGTVTLYSGSNNQGQGHETIFKQLVCDRLGLDPNEAQYIQGDTDEVFFGEGTGGSRSATLAGSAFHMATEKIVAKARKIAAHALEAAEDDIEFADGTFRVVGTDRAVSLKDTAQAAYVPARLPEGLETGLYEVASFSPEVPNFPNGCHVCEVEIDPETGTTRVLRYVVVDDVGTVINPLTLEGQIHGGVAQGIGQAFTEHLVYDERLGQPLSGSFMDYGLPRADEVCSFEMDENPVPTKTNPLGVKGAGEAGNVGALAAIMNAIVDALSPLGIAHIDMPATPEKVWRAIREKQGRWPKW